MENLDKGLTVPKMGADKLPIIKYPKCPKIYLPKLSVQAQKCGIWMKKGFIGRTKSAFKSFFLKSYFNKTLKRILKKVGLWP
jgi:hypothetical protein